MNLFDLTGKTAIVTGSTRGIGLAIAQALMAAGAKVIVSSENAQDTQAAAQALGTLGVPADVRSQADLSALLEAALQLGGGLDILVCNAGITGQPGPISRQPMDDYDTVMDINLRSQVLLTQLAQPMLAARGGGAVVLISSISALRGNGAIGAYALSKAAIGQLARNLAVEWGPAGIRVNAIAPGLIRTPLSQGLMEDQTFMARRLAMTPLRRVGEPQEIAGAVVFLASAAGAFITGQTLVIDGGTLITDGS